MFDETEGIIYKSHEIPLYPSTYHYIPLYTNYKPIKIPLNHH